jgi:diketogulonate reductase-like aldo/keto reductase
MTLKAYNQVPMPSFMYGTAWKKEATTQLVELAVASGFKAIDTANQLIPQKLSGEACRHLEARNREIPYFSNQVTSVDGQDSPLRCLGRSHHPGKTVL